MPFLAPLLTNGLGTLAGAILDNVIGEGKDKAEEIIKSVTGLSIDLGSNPTAEQLEALKNSQVSLMDRLAVNKETNRHEEAIMLNNFNLDKLSVDDVKSAREANMVYAKSESWLVQNFLPLFSMVLFIMIFWSMSYILENHVEGITATVVMEFDKAIALLVVGFWFGSSSGSKNKDKAFEHYLKVTQNKEARQPKIYEDDYVAPSGVDYYGQ